MKILMVRTSYSRKGMSQIKRYEYEILGSSGILSSAWRIEVIDLIRIVEKNWHKLGLIVCMFYLSAEVITVILPTMWIHYKIPILEYYSFSFGYMIIGAIFFDLLLISIYPRYREDLKSGEFPKRFIIIAFVGKIILFTILGTVTLIFTKEFILGIYSVVFPLFGGYIWFHLLRAYNDIKVNGKDQEKDKRKETRYKWFQRITWTLTVIAIIGAYFYTH